MGQGMELALTPMAAELAQTGSLFVATAKMALVLVCGWFAIEYARRRFDP